jgi:hypothetical protein
VEAVGRLKDVRILGSEVGDGGGTVLEVTGDGGIQWTLMVTNGPASTTARHRVTGSGRTFEWTGNYSVTGVQHAR